MQNSRHPFFLSLVLFFVKSGIQKRNGPVVFTLFFIFIVVVLLLLLSLCSSSTVSRWSFYVRVFAPPFFLVVVVVVSARAGAMFVHVAFEIFRNRRWHRDEKSVFQFDLFFLRLDASKRRRRRNRRRREKQKRSDDEEERREERTTTQRASKKKHDDDDEMGGVIFARVVFVKKIARDHKIYITVLMNKRRGVLVLLFGDFDIPSGSHRIRVFFVYRTTLLQMRFLWDPNLREQTERRAVL